MNIADSERYSSVLNKHGLEETANLNDSNLVLVNTCVVRGKAEERAISYLAELENLRRNSGLRYILAGCLSPRIDMTSFKRRFPGLLFAINPSEIDNFEEILKEHLNRLEPIYKHYSEPQEELLDETSEEIVKFQFHSFVTVMRGCEQNCTYCVVPFSRGANYSLPQDEILDEIKERIHNGAKAITLLGQSILDYGKDWDGKKHIKAIHGDAMFRDLLDVISNRFPNVWIKFLTSHPKDFTFETVDLIASRENITKFIHLPVQSGDNAILKKMGRGHTREQYLELINYIKDKIPKVRLSSDIIVGFPGETEEAYENSLDLLRQARFHKVFTFQYSPRPSTPALKFEDNIPFDEKRLRLNRLIDIQNQITLECHKEIEGEEIIAMVEGSAKGDDSSLMARSRDEDIIIFHRESNIEPGDIIRLKIVEGKLRTLRGKFIGKN